MRNRNHGHGRWKLITGTAAIALAVAVNGVAMAAPAPGQGGAVQVNITGGDLGKALAQLGREAGVQIVFLPDRVRGRKAKALRGTYTVEQALERLLAGTGLRYQKTQGGTYVVGGPTEEALNKARAITDDLSAAGGRDAQGQIVVPEILVVGTRDWTLNLDIPRTQDDAQPYVVFNKEQIARSGATSLEDFFKNFLGANNSGSVSTQTQTGNKSQSFVNLRGLGSANTLILVDGRRYSQANVGDGVFSQSSVNGIPLDAIERIEVLPSSASGIYGSNAVGGVINIIMRRNFSGIEANVYYGNTSRLDAFENRASVNGSFPLERGKTRISFTGSWQKTGALYEGDRDYIERGRAQLLANAPGYFSTVSNPPQGATPNVVSADGGVLVLKSQYGSTSLGSRITYVPIGYRGVALDGTAPLVANAGKFNLDLSPTATTGPAGDGRFNTLLTPTQSYNASLTVKREFAKWLSLYVEGSWSRYDTTQLVNPAAGTYTLPATAQDNPFTRPIIVSVPIANGNQRVTNASTNWRLLTGAIIKLPLNWQAAIDLSWNWNTYAPGAALPAFDKATYDAVQLGTIDLLRDLTTTPPTFGYLNGPATGLIRPSRGYSRSYSLKLAGPIPLLRLWGGKPVVTLLLEQDKQTQGEYVAFSNNTTNSSINFTPARSQRTDSAYGELRLPIIGERNKVPLIRELELQVAARYDRYVGIGSNATLNCFPGTSTIFAAPLPDSAYTSPCPQAGAKPVFATTRNSSTNPTIAVKWAVAKDLTFRGSYSTGYLPPYLNSVVSTDAGIPGTILAGQTIVNVTDPLRGNEAIGDPKFVFFRVLPARIGGNPNVDPQTSKNWSFGGILTPTFLPGFRLSVDWSRITQNNIYFQPSTLLGNGNIPGGQQAFNDFLAAHPERFTRDTNPATFGAYTVGPIIFADVTTANLSRARSEAIDFAASYDRPLGKGRLSVQAAATWLLDLRVQTTPSAAPLNATGVIDNGFLAMLGALGGVEWKGNGSVVYSTDRWSFGTRVRYIGSYWLNTSRTVQPLQGSAKIGAQAYVDIFGTFKLTPKTQLRAGINNLLDRSPPINSTTTLFYSFYGDPRRANFYLSINRRF